jgi:hypothetical protein
MVPSEVERRGSLYPLTAKRVLINVKPSDIQLKVKGKIVFVLD